MVLQSPDPYSFLFAYGGLANWSRAFNGLHKVLKGVRVVTEGFHVP